LGGVSIDGNIDEFSSANSVSFWDLVPDRGADSNSATVWSMWDENYLYFAYQVEDTKLNSEVTSSGDEIWKDDNLEIFIDGDNDHNEWVGTNTDDSKYFVNLRNVLDSEGALAGAMQSAVVLNGSLNSNSDTDTGYTIELAIPWTAVGKTPSEGLRLGSNLCAGDLDLPEDGYQYYDWAGIDPDTYSNNTYRWGDLILSGQSCTPTNGDGNGDGKATPNDFAIWALYFELFNPVEGGAGSGDFNCDGHTNANDFAIWALYFTPY
jgi:hypothetical protein